MRIRIFILFVGLLVMVTTAYGAERSPAGLVSGAGVNLRTEPATSGRIISVLEQGLPVVILEQADDWYKIRLEDGLQGWVYSRFIAAQPLTTGTPGGDISVLPVDAVLGYAKNFLGITYVYGGDSQQGFDCSGFTMHVFAKFGIKLPHEADLQIAEGTAVSTIEALLPGDLVFFRTMGSTIVNHVGIYLGGNRFIHASSGYGAVRISPLDGGYYYDCYAGGRRLGAREGGTVPDES